ncbi:hypothetical protein QQ045_023858 [Rhodiola kirilowii]
MDESHENTKLSSSAGWWIAIRCLCRVQLSVIKPKNMACKGLTVLDIVRLKLVSLLKPLVPAVEVKSPSLGSRLAAFRKDAGLISWDTIGRYGMRNFMPDKKMKTVYCLKLSIKWNI